MSCPCPAGRGRGRGAGGGGCPRYPHPLQAAGWDTACRAPALRHPLLLAVPPHQLPHRLQPRGCGEAAHHHVASPRPPASGVRPCSRWPRFRWSRGVSRPPAAAARAAGAGAGPLHRAGVAAGPEGGRGGARGRGTHGTPARGSLQQEAGWWRRGCCVAVTDWDRHMPEENYCRN